MKKKLKQPGRKPAANAPATSKRTEEPADARSWQEQVSAYYAQGRYDQALTSALKAIDLAEAANPQVLRVLQSYYYAAMCHYRRKDYSRAEALARTALRRYPKNPDARFVLTLIQYESRAWDQVVLHGSEFLNLLNGADPCVTASLPEAWNIEFLLGIAEDELGRGEACLQHLEQAIRRAPDPFVVMRASGLHFHQKRNYPLARRFLERALALKPGDATTRSLLRECTPADAAAATPRITCCMIVKNEEAFLDRCLRSVKDWVDEIVIVDTGSTDRSVEIARAYTGNVFFHPWEGSFSKARNQALSYATGDWVFQIDGDEELMKGNGPKLREAVQNAGDADAVFVNIISIYGNGSKRACHNFERLFRRNGVIHYEGIVHNRVVGYRHVNPSKIEMMHYGYNVDEKKAHEKFLRTTHLLKEQIAENPQDPLPHHYLSASYLSREMYAEAAEEAVRALRLVVERGITNDTYLWTHFIASMAHYKLGRVAEAETYAREALCLSRDHLDSHFMLTLVSARKKDWLSTERLGQRFLELFRDYSRNPERADFVVNNTMREESTVYLLLGHAAHARSDRGQMNAAYSDALEHAAEPWVACRAIAGYHLEETGDLELADTYLQRGFQLAPDQADIWYLQAMLHAKRHCPESEMHWLKRLIGTDREDLFVCNRLSQLNLEAGDMNVAEQAARAALARDPSNLKALQTLSQVYRQQGCIEQEMEVLSRIANSYPDRADAWLRLGELCLHLHRPAEAKAFFGRAHSIAPQSLGAVLGLMDAALMENDISDAVRSCDNAMGLLGMDRDRRLESMDDFTALLLDIFYELRSRPEGDRLKSVLKRLSFDRALLNRIPFRLSDKKAFLLKEFDASPV